jgi:hypothetical protein
MKKDVFFFEKEKYEHAIWYKYFTSDFTPAGDTVYYASDSLINLKKKIKDLGKPIYHGIFTHYEKIEGKLKMIKQPYFVELYKPRAGKN